MPTTPAVSLSKVITLGGIAIAHAKILILGGGVTGRSVAQVLSNMGAEIYVYDENESSEFDFRRATLSDVTDVSWATAVISPGWRPSHPIVADLRNREIPLLNEID